MFIKKSAIPKGYRTLFLWLNSSLRLLAQCHEIGHFVEHARADVSVPLGVRAYFYEVETNDLAAAFHYSPEKILSRAELQASRYGSASAWAKCGV